MPTTLSDISHTTFVKSAIDLVNGQIPMNNIETNPIGDVIVRLSDVPTNSTLTSLIEKSLSVAVIAYPSMTEINFGNCLVGGRSIKILITARHKEYLEIFIK